MRYLQILLLSIFILLPSLGNSAVVTHSEIQRNQQVEISSKKKEKPKKNIRKWIRNHPGLLIFGGLFLAGLAMLIVGIINQVKWLWLVGLITIIGPWILVIILAFLALFFGTRPRPIPPYIDPETTEKQKGKSKK